MADEKTTWILDLDGKKFILEAKKAKKEGDKIGKSGADNAKKFQDALRTATVAIGTMGAALLFLKANLDSAFRTDKIKSMTQQWEILTNQFGLAGDTLKRSFLSQTEGMISSADALELGNNALAKLGENADRLPEIMDLAHKASTVTGKSIAETFTRLVDALSQGEAGALKQLGLIIDTDKALRKQAQALGVSVTALSQAEKMQSVLNAAMEEGHKKFGQIDTDITRNADEYARLTSTVQNFGDRILIALDGPLVSKVFKNIADKFQFLNEQLAKFMGQDDDAAEIRISRLRSSLADMQEALTKLQAGEGAGAAITEFFGQTDTAIENIKANIATTKEEIESLNKELLKSGTRTPGGAGDLAEIEKKNDLKIAADAKFQRELLGLQAQTVQAKLRTLEDETQALALINEQKSIMEKDFQARIDEIRVAVHLNDKQRPFEIEQLNKLKTEKLIELEMQLESVRIRALDNYLRKSQTVAQGVARGFEVGSKKAAADWENFGLRGSQVFDSFKNNATQNLIALGEGTKSAADAAKGFIFGMLADRAIAEGQLMMLSGIWPPNPAALAGGAALIALGGFLRGQAKGGSSMGGGAGSIAMAGAEPTAAGGGGIQPAEIQSRTPEIDDLQREKKIVSIIIQGSYFETEETRTRLVEMIREESDATDFNIKSIGEA